VNNRGDILNAGNLRDVGRHMQAGTDGNGVALPLLLFAGGLGAVGNDVAGAVLTRHLASDVSDLRVEIDVRPKLKLGAVLGDVLSVALGSQEVRLIITSAEVREAGELLGGDKLRESCNQHGAPGE